MGHPLTPEEKNTVIEDALHTYPIATMPRGISTDVMSRIQNIPTSRPFRLTWSDLVLGIVFAVCLGAVEFSVYHLPPLAVAQIRKESILLYQQMLVNERWLIPALSFGLAAFFAALTIPYLRQELMK
jgi:hypothetical protein